MTDLARRAKIREAFWAASRVEDSLLSYGSGRCGFAPGRPEPPSGRWVIVPAAPYGELTSMLRHLDGFAPWPGQLPETPRSMGDGNIARFDDDCLGPLREFVADHHQLGFGHGQAAPAESQTELDIERGRGPWVALDARALPSEVMYSCLLLDGRPRSPATARADPEQLVALTTDLLDHARASLTSIVPWWRDFDDVEIASFSVHGPGDRLHRLVVLVAPDVEARDVQGASRSMRLVGYGDLWKISTLFATGTVEGLDQVLQRLDVEAMYHLVSHMLARIDDRYDQPGLAPG